ncbi:MAG: outer membrane protein [Candidatus Rokuibacteriota bacterium]
MRRRGLLVVAAILVLLTVVPVPASAEVFFDLYFGGAFTFYNDLEARFGSTFQGLEDVRYDDSILGGARLGYWFERPIIDRLSFGLGVDVFHFTPDIDFQTVDGVLSAGGVALAGEFAVLPIDISVVAVSLDLMFRWPLMASPAFPRGRLQPYLTVGPAIFFSEIEDSDNFAPGGQSDSDTTVGFKFGVGLAYHLHRNLAIFGEYRFTYFSPEWNVSDLGEQGKLETDITTFYLLVGLSLRF